jgi:hypothetical protein
MQPEYDFSGGEQGKYLARYREGTNVVLLDPDVAAVFPDAAAVNRTLRLLVNVARSQVAGTKHVARVNQRRRRDTGTNLSKATTRHRRASGR